MKIIAHRGFAEDGPENTMQTFEDAESSADYIELDVLGSSDGVPVVVHDNHLDRLCDTDLCVTETPSSEITQQRVLETDQTIPKLQDVLRSVGGPVIVEIKDRDIVDTTVEMCKDSGVDVVFQSFYPSVLRSLPDDVQKMVLCTPERFLDIEGVPNSSVTTIPDAAELADEIGSRGINPHHSMCSRDSFEMISDEYTVFAWTVRSKETAKELGEINGVDGWITDSINYVE